MRKGIKNVALFNQRGRKLPLNIQMFAEPDVEGDKDKEVDYKAEYEKLKADNEKLKREKDNASKDAKNWKDQYKAKENAEEAKARQESEKEQMLNQIILENKKMKFEKALSQSNVLSADEVAKISEVFFQEDNSFLPTTINEVITKKLEDQKKKLMAEYKRGFNVPGLGGNEKSSVEEFAKSLAKANATSTDKFDSYFRK